MFDFVFIISCLKSNVINHSFYISRAVTLVQKSSSEVSKINATKRHVSKGAFHGNKSYRSDLGLDRGDTPRVTEVVSIFGDKVSIFGGKVSIFGNKGY